jgi:hypothetical protein
MRFAVRFAEVGTVRVTQDDAINQGMQICHDANNSICFVYYVDCSPPLRIQ